MIRISVIAVWFLSVSVVWAQNETGVLPDSDVEPLLRGPVHEAFAEPIQLNPEEMLTVPKSPPPLVEEVPPDARPAGEGVNWIPGYWAWDDEREDFIWVSGIYRRTPSGRSWQAGQWEEVADGYRWLPGRWISTTGVGELLPTPRNRSKRDLRESQSPRITSGCRVAGNIEISDTFGVRDSGPPVTTIGSGFRTTTLLA